MRKLLLILLIVPLCISCHKDTAVEPLIQYNFINFVDESGKNLFASNKIPTSKFNYISGTNTYPWEDVISNKKRELAQIESIPEAFQDTMRSLLSDEYLLLEDYQGNLERERIFSINGKQYNFRFSLKDGFFQNSEALEYKTDTVSNYHIYIQHIVLKEY